MNSNCDNLIEELRVKAEACAGKMVDLSFYSLKYAKDFSESIPGEGIEISPKIKKPYLELRLYAKFLWEADSFGSVKRNLGKIEKKFSQLQKGYKENPNALPLYIVGKKIFSLAQIHFENIINGTDVELSLVVPDDSVVELDESGHIGFHASLKLINPFKQISPNLRKVRVCLDGQEVFPPIEAGQEAAEVGYGTEYKFDVREPVTAGQWQWGKKTLKFEIKYDVENWPKTKEYCKNLFISCRLMNDQLSLFGEQEADGKKFIGRKDELGLVLACFKSSKSNHGFIVTGQRRSGKSSFIKRSGELLTNEGLKCIRISLYGDNKETHDERKKSPFQIIFGRISEALGISAGADLSEGACFDFIAEKMREDPCTYVIAIDEYQELYNDYWTVDESGRKKIDDVAQKLRWLMTQECCHLLISAQDYIYEYKKLKNVFAPLRRLRMSYFTEEEVVELAAKMDPPKAPHLRRLDGPAVRWLYEFTGGHPMFAQQVCAYLAGVFFRTKEYRLESSKYEETEWRFIDPDSVVNPVLSYASFESFFQLRLFEDALQPLDESRLLSFYFSIAKSTGPAKLDNHERWINELVERGIIKRSKAGYELRARIFAKWLAARAIEDCPIDRFL